jgi:perosamine synthetase
LSLALLAAGVKAGDDVIVPDITMIATATAAQLVGINPVFVDLDPFNLCLDLNLAKQAILNNPHIKAVFYVALNGRSHMAETLREFMGFCKKRGVAFIEDAAQAFGSKTSDDVYVGTIGDIGSFSFSPHKIVACGQGGALVTNDKDTYERIERLKDFGRLAGGADVHDYFGINSKFTDIQAVIGLEQLKKLPARIKLKKEMLGKYIVGLGNIVEHLHFTPSAVPWFQDIYVDKRDELMFFLKGKGVQTRPLYPALHTQKIFARPNDFPVATEYASKGLWLPSSLSLSDRDLIYVCDQIKAFYK